MDTAGDPLDADQVRKLYVHATILAEVMEKRRPRIAAIGEQLCAEIDDLQRFAADERSALAASLGCPSDVAAEITETMMKAAIGNLDEAWLKIGRVVSEIFSRVPSQRGAAEAWFQAQDRILREKPQ